MSKPSELSGLLSQVKSAADKIKDKISGLDDQIDALYKKRSHIVSGALSKSDYLDTIRADIQTKTQRFSADLKRHLDGAMVGYPSVARAHADGLPIRYLKGGRTIPEVMAEEAYYFYFEDAILAGVERALEGKEWPTDAVPAAERATALQVIGEQIEALTAERDTLADDLVSCGVTE